MKVTSASAFMALWLGATSIQAFAPLVRQVEVLRPLSTTKTVRFATVPEKDEEQIQTSSTKKIPSKDFASDAFNKVTPSLFEGVPYSELTIGVLAEDLEGENRVSQTPDTVRNLVKEGFTVIVEAGGKLLSAVYGSLSRMIGWEVQHF